MSVEDIGVIESSEGGSNTTEISEKYKESAKKASAGIKRTQKDEKKAKKYDFLLARFLVEMILKKKYDDILGELFLCLDSGYGTNFLLGILSLIYLPISHEIRTFAGKESIDFVYETGGEVTDFDDHALPEAVRNRINEWIEDMETVAKLEVSSILTKRTLSLILYDDKIRKFTSRVFMFFFSEIQIRISESQAQKYGDFILGELQKTLKQSLPQLEEKWTSKGLEI